MGGCTLSSQILMSFISSDNRSKTEIRAAGSLIEVAAVALIEAMVRLKEVEKHFLGLNGEEKLINHL